MSFTNYLETEILDFAFTTGTATRPTSWFIALYTAAPGEGGGGTEVSGSGYVRQSVAFSVSGNTATNTAAVEFPTATGSYGTVSHVGVFDASSSGNLLAFSALNVAKAIDTGDVFRIPTGDLDITLD
jgi:hypothetical protein|tara:strand:+ start:2160 stop:2540 length:381 start_codon:yes stop_codon:yes gene_type:complete